MWKFQIGSMCQGGPAVHGGAVYFGARNGKLYAVSLEGKLLWTFQAQDIVSGNIRAFGDRVVFGSLDNYLYCLNPDGSLAWKFRTGSYISNDTTLCKGNAVFASFDRNVYAVKLDSGELSWKFRMSLPPVALIASYGDRIYIGSRDRNLYVLSSDGRLCWKFTFGHMPLFNVYYNGCSMWEQPTTGFMPLTGMAGLYGNTVQAVLLCHPVSLMIPSMSGAMTHTFMP